MPLTEPPLELDRLLSGRIFSTFSLVAATISLLPPALLACHIPSAPVPPFDTLTTLVTVKAHWWKSLLRFRQTRQVLGRFCDLWTLSFHLFSQGAHRCPAPLRE